MSLLTLASRVTGLLRESLIAALFGASALTDAFRVAFLLPNMFRRLFAEGAFSQAFIPVLGQTRTQQGEAATKRLVDRVASLLAAQGRNTDYLARQGRSIGRDGIVHVHYNGANIEIGGHSVMVIQGTIQA